MRDIPLNGPRVIDAVHSSLYTRTPDTLAADFMVRLAQRDADRARYMPQHRTAQVNTLADQLDAMVEAVVAELPRQESAKPPTLTETLSATLAGLDTTTTTEPASRSVADVIRDELSHSE